MKILHERIVIVGNITEDTIQFVDRMPKLDDVSTVRSTVRCIGGRGAVVWSIASQTTNSVSLISSVGGVSDHRRNSAVEIFKATEETLIIDEARETPGVHIVVGKEEQDCISFFTRGTLDYNPTSKQVSRVQAAEVALFTTYNIEASIDLLEVASANRIIVSTTPYMWAVEEYAQKVRAKATSLVGNRLEFEALFGTDVWTRPAAITSNFKQLERVYITLGREGAIGYSVNEGVLERVSAPSVNVVTPVGVGDAFAAGVLVAEVRGRSVRQAMLLGTSFASASLEALATIPMNEPVREAYDKWMSNL